MNNIKKYIIPTIFLLAFGLSGCYTVIWSPDTPMPADDNNNNSYYDSPYYGEYYYYYHNHWWDSYFRNGYNQTGSAYYRDTSRAMTNLRNDNGRNGGYTPGLQAPPVSTTATVERSGGSSGSADVKRNENSGTRNSSGSVNENSRGSSSNSANKNSNNDRNSNGRN